MKQPQTILVALLVAVAVSLGFASAAQAACVGGAPNSFYQPDSGEECDDGNQINGDGCENDCTMTSGFVCDLTIDLDELQTEGAGSNWTPGRYSREQTLNTTTPTYAFFGGDAFARTYTLGIQVNQTTYAGNNAVGDDDFIGFALGINPGDSTNPNAKYLVLDWKGKTQKMTNPSLDAPGGMRLSLVEGVPTKPRSFWFTDDVWPESERKLIKIAEGAHQNILQGEGTDRTYGNSGWENQSTEYTFEITYTADRLVVKVKSEAAQNATEQTVLDVMANDPAHAALFPNGFPDGEIAFYGLSQALVQYTVLSPLDTTCAPLCGDGVIVGSETCDGGLAGSSDCNSNTCRLNVTLDAPVDQSVTSNPRPTISGTGDVGATITVVVGEGATAETLTTTVDSSGNWSVTPTANVAVGINDITVSARDVLRGTSTATGSFEYVTHFVAIATPSAPNTLFGGDAYSGFVPVTGTGVTGSTVILSLDGVPTGDTAVVDATGNWSTSISIPTDGDYVIKATSTDSYNVSDEDSVTVTVDSTTSVAITAPANGSIHSAPITTISGDGEAGATVVVTINGQTATTTVAANGTWTVTAPGGPLTNDEFTATAVITDLANNTATATSTFDVHVDACAADADNCDANATCTDTGAGGLYDCNCNAGYIGEGETCVQGPQVTIATPGDGTVVTVATPTISGTANPNTTVTVVIDGIETQTVTSDASGNWSVVPATPLTEGTHTVQATVEIEGETATDNTTFSINTDVCGEALNSCEDSSTCEDLGDGTAQCNCDAGYVKDAADLCALAPAVTILTPADQSTIRTTTPTLTGSANPNTVVTISIDGDIVGTTTSDNDGSWTFTVPAPSPLDADGPYEFTASTTVGDTTATDDVTLALHNEPNVVIIESPAEDASVSTTPTVTGTSNPNAEITIVIRGEEKGTTTADENGSWTWTSTEELDLGPADIVAIDKDNDEQDDVNVTIDRQQAPVVITGPADNSETADTTPTVTGTGEPNTTVTIFVDGKEVGTVPVDNNGKWTWTPVDGLEEGPHTILAKSDNGTEDQIALTITVDGETPIIPDDDELTITGGKVFGCSSTSNEVPVGVIVLFGLGVVALARRRTDKAA